jgi:hypothetical protein
MFPKLFFITPLYDLCYQWTSLDIISKEWKKWFWKEKQTMAR